MVIVAIWGKGWLRAALSYSRLVWLGKISYGLYMYHEIALWIREHLPLASRLVPEQGGAAGDRDPGPDDRPGGGLVLRLRAAVLAAQEGAGPGCRRGRCDEHRTSIVRMYRVPFRKCERWLSARPLEGVAYRDWGLTSSLGRILHPVAMNFFSSCETPGTEASTDDRSRGAIDRSRLDRADDERWTIRESSAKREFWPETELNAAVRQGTDGIEAVDAEAGHDYTTDLDLADFEPLSEARPRPRVSRKRTHVRPGLGRLRPRNRSPGRDVDA